eukprot:gene17928-36613_t
MGILLGLGLLWLVGDLVHRKEEDLRKQRLTLARALTRIDMSSIVFFIGILLSVAVLEHAHVLSSIAHWLDTTVGRQDLIVLLIGLVSAVVDNVPLVAASMGMYSLAQYPTDSFLWEFLAYCAGTGGSILIIGSAAGVAAMGLEKIDFLWYVRKISGLALLGYIAGALTYLRSANAAKETATSIEDSIEKSARGVGVCGTVETSLQQIVEKARQMEEEGHKITKLNIGNLAVFGFDPPDEIVHDMVVNLHGAAGYTDSKGMFAPRKAVMHYTQGKNIAGVTIDDIYLGNGASELIVMSMNALLNTGDEVLVPAPDYPLWTAAVSLSGGTPVHYVCDEQQDWFPDIEDMRRKITSNTKAIVVINPNNPTGALYPNEILLQIIELARQHQLIIDADEISETLLYDQAQHTSIAPL